MTDTADLATSASDDLTGKQLAGYRLLRRLGRGAMADVYLAQQESLDRQVAVKVLHAALANDETYVRRFRHEAQAAARLVHSAIVQVYEVGSQASVHFIAQEYVPGMNLAQLVQRQGPPELSRALSIIRQVASALRKAGQHGIIHRDIKPENIMLASTGEVKVADFGLARLAGDTALNLTQIGFTVGTPLYMSPEQIEGRPLDPRSDIYSLGVTSYYMLSGQLPFRGESALSVAMQHLRGQPERLENVRPDLPPALCRTVHKMMAKQPEDRHQNGAEVLDDLRAMGVESGDDSADAENHLPRTDMSGLTQTLSDAMRRASNRSGAPRPWMLAAGCAVAVIVGLAAAWATRPEPLLPLEVAALSADLKPTAQQQFEYARRIDSEAGWQSVFRFYPEQRELGLEAKQQLARWYIDQQRYDDALEIFQELAAVEEQRWKALGLLGSALMLSLENQPGQARRRLQELRPLRGELPQREAGALVAQVLAEKRQTVPADIRSQLQWIRRPAPPRRPGGRPSQ